MQTLERRAAVREIEVEERSPVPVDLHALRSATSRNQSQRIWLVRAVWSLGDLPPIATGATARLQTFHTLASASGLRSASQPLVRIALRPRVTIEKPCLVGDDDCLDVVMEVGFWRMCAMWVLTVASRRPMGSG